MISRYAPNINLIFLLAAKHYSSAPFSVTSSEFANALAYANVLRAQLFEVCGFAGTKYHLKNW